MNRKLRDFPAFANAIGIRCVRNCDEARVFAKAYKAYQKDHPGFDDKQPSEPPRPLPPPPAELFEQGGPRSDAERP